MVNRIKIFCFTYAGGSATFYNSLEDELSEIFEFHKMDYAGHGKRYREAFYSDFDELAEDMYKSVKSKCNPNDTYLLMGYSMGSIVAFEVLRMIESRREIIMPKHVFLAAHEPCTKLKLLKFANEISDEEVKARTIEFGGIPKELEKNKSFWRVYLPIYRADYALIGMYDFDNKFDSFQVPATVFYSESDTPIDKMKIWKRFFVMNCEFVEYTGNHFFMNEHYSEIARKIIERVGGQE